jgi:uncharacterized protein involved in exopolysaccharide biosynthesis
MEQSNAMPMNAAKSSRRSLWLALAAFLGLSALMYVSIIYKIINYGP